MKKAAAAAMLLALMFLSACGAQGEGEIDIAPLVPENVTRAELRGHGETVIIEDAGEIAALIGTS